MPMSSALTSFSSGMGASSTWMDMQWDLNTTSTMQLKVLAAVFACGVCMGMLLLMAMLWCGWCIFNRCSAIVLCDKTKHVEHMKKRALKGDALLHEMQQTPDGMVDEVMPDVGMPQHEHNLPERELKASELRTFSNSLLEEVCGLKGIHLGSKPTKESLVQALVSTDMATAPQIRFLRSLSRKHGVMLKACNLVTKMAAGTCIDNMQASGAAVVL